MAAAASEKEADKAYSFTISSNQQPATNFYPGQQPYYPAAQQGYYPGYQGFNTGFRGYYPGQQAIYPGYQGFQGFQGYQGYYPGYQGFQGYQGLISFRYYLKGIFTQVLCFVSLHWCVDSSFCF